MANAELEAHLGNVAAQGQNRGPQVEAMQRELAALESFNRKLQQDLERAGGRVTAGSPVHMSPGPRADELAALQTELRRKNADLNRANTLVDIKSQECSRLRDELSVAQSKREEAAEVAAQATTALRESMARVQAMELAYSGAPPDPTGAMHKVFSLEREKADMEHAMRELVSETNGKAKTISDLLALQDEMVLELDAMRKDLSSMGHGQGGGNTGSERDRAAFEAVLRQKELLEAEKEELQDALYRYQQSGATPGTLDDSEAMRRIDILSGQLASSNQEKLQLEDALRRFHNVDEQIEHLQAENRQLEEAFSRYRETRRGSIEGSVSGGDLAGERVERMRLQEEVSRLQRLLADQSKLILQRNVAKNDSEELYRLRDGIMSLDRNIAPAVRDLQRSIISAPAPSPGNNSSSSYNNRMSYESLGHSMGGPAPPMRSVDPMRSSMPEPMEYGEHPADRNLYGTWDSSQPGLYNSLPKSYGQSQPVSKERTDSSLMDAYRSSQSASTLSSMGGTASTRLRSSSPLLGAQQPPLVSQRSPQKGTLSSGVKLGLDDDILNYQPPSSSRRLYAPSVTSPEVSGIKASSARTPSEYVSSLKSPAPPAKADEYGRRVVSERRLPDSSLAPNTRVISESRSSLLAVAAGQTKGLSPSEYVKQRIKGGSGQAVASSASASATSATMIASSTTSSKYDAPSTSKYDPSATYTYKDQTESKAPPPSPERNNERGRLIEGVESVDNDGEMTQDRLDRFARYQQEVRHTPLAPRL